MVFKIQYCLNYVTFSAYLRFLTLENQPLLFIQIDQLQVTFVFNCINFERIINMRKNEDIKKRPI
jgi:hypothetical protein